MCFFQVGNDVPMSRPEVTYAPIAAGVHGDVPVLCDGDIVLDGLTMEDADAHAAGEDDEMARRFGWYPNRSTVEGVRAYLAANATAWRDGSPRRAWAIRLAATRVLVGGCEIRLKDHHSAQMSWWVFPNYRRQGIASRAVRLVANYASGHLDICQLEAFIALDNSGSRGVARNAGFSPAELVLDGEQYMLRHVLRLTGGGASDGEWQTRDS
jgi:RimJ/RimL family protein N-acetyltransferase